MENGLLVDLLGAVDKKIFQIVVNLILMGAFFLWIKDLNSRIVAYVKLRMSNFGRGTKVKIGGYEGHIYHIGFDQVEIILDEQSTLLMPVNKFMNSSKVIITSIPKKK